MASLLSCGMESSDRIAEHVDDARRMGIKVLPPDVNQSDVEFSVVGDDLTFGLGQLKDSGKPPSRRSCKSGRRTARLPAFLISPNESTRNC